MKIILVNLILIQFLAFSINAATVLVWNFNPGDTEYPNGYDYHADPEADNQEVNCSYWIKATLDSNNQSYTYHDELTLPSDINSYDIIIATLGYYHC